MKICPVRAELLHANGRTNRHDEDNSHFSELRKAPKKLDLYPLFTLMLQFSIP